MRLRQAVNATNVAMMQPCWANLVQKACGQSAKGPPVGRGGYIESVGKEFIVTAGDWTYESPGKIYYALRAGETAATLKAVVPKLEVLVSNVGASSTSFEGFTFEYATWLRPGQCPLMDACFTRVCPIYRVSYQTTVSTASPSGTLLRGSCPITKYARLPGAVFERAYEFKQCFVIHMLPLFYFSNGGQKARFDCFASTLGCWVQKASRILNKKD